MTQVAGARAALKQLDVVTLLSLRPADAVDSGKVVCISRVTTDPVQEWQQETRALVKYADKVWYGRLMSKVVEEGRRLPPASTQTLVTLLEAEPNFSVARDTLYMDLPDSLKARMVQSTSTTMAELVTRAVAPIYDTLPPRYVPHKTQVVQAMVTWWVSKLSLPVLKRT
jgi:hypothetical protein